MPTHKHSRRSALVLAVAAAGAALAGGRRSAASAERPGAAAAPARRWFDAAVAMQRLSESWGDQPYGAVLVAGGEIIGEGPSRVVLRGDPSAHAEREAIRDAQQRLGRASLAGSVLYSTSRPCAACENAAAAAGIARMIYGEQLADAGRPQAR